MAFVFAGIALLLLGLTALVQGDRTKAELFEYGSAAVLVLLLISALSDYVAILDSIADNYKPCVHKGRDSLPYYMQPDQLDCSFFRYYLTVLMTVISACLVVCRLDNEVVWIRIYDAQDQTHSRSRLLDYPNHTHHTCSLRIPSL